MFVKSVIKKEVNNLEINGITEGRHWPVIKNVFAWVLPFRGVRGAQAKIFCEFKQSND